MKLNNHGWGMREMIIYTCTLLLFLLIASFLVHSFYSQLESDLSNRDRNRPNTTINSTTADKPTNIDQKTVIDYSIYKDYEEKLDLAAKVYVINNYAALETNIATVELSQLVAAGYIEQLYDQVDNGVCSGYSNVWDNELGEYEVESYIRCTNYVTEGY